MLTFYLYYKFVLEASSYDKIQINFPTKHVKVRSAIHGLKCRLKVNLSQPFNFHLHMNFILAESADVYTATS